MTEFEISSMTYVANEAANTALTLYLTVVSAYLIVAYTVGKRLTKSQLVFVNCLFVFFSIAFTYSTTVSFFAMRFYTEIQAEIADTPGEKYLYIENLFVAILAIALVLGIIGSLKFMWDVRHPKA